MTAVGRNEPCPCGSGKRYKHCHGAVAATPVPVEPLSADTLVQQGMEAYSRGDLAGSEQRYRAALALVPEHPIALHNLGIIFYQRRLPDEALTLIDRALALMPQEPEFHNNRGLALAAASREDEAIAAYKHVLELKPEHTGAWNNLGLTLQSLGDVTGAIAAFRRGLESAPDFPQLHWNLALALLLRGDYRHGWREYEWRLRAPSFASSLVHFPGPRWTGDDPSGRTLLVTAEQGFGDAIQNLRFVQRLAAMDARVLVVTDAPLHALAATAPGVSGVYGVDKPLPAYDAHVPLMSLPGLLGVELSDVTVSLPYLHADAQRSRQAAVAVEREAGSAFKVGVAWAGAPGHTNDARRSMALAKMAPLFDVANTRLFSLKREGEAITPTDASWAERLVNLDLRNDFDGLAALIMSLDLVISVDTSLVHLAGALGKPVWVLLPFAPDWRWGLARSDSPWYPTARLFRQRTAGEWSDPVSAVSDALRESATQKFS
jgi:tetratricopeptide (TPR) repeat protein